MVERNTDMNTPDIVVVYTNEEAFYRQSRRRVKVPMADTELREVKIGQTRNGKYEVVSWLLRLPKVNQ